MTDDILTSETPEGDKKGQEGVDWFWVLTSPITIFRDKMLILEVDGVNVTPVFAVREEGESFLERVNPTEWHVVQAMHVTDIRKFAVNERLGIITLDGEGKILQVWDLKEEPAGSC
jgi:hypothetical protein